MDFKLFFLGIAFLVAAYLIYRWIKNDQPSSEATDWNGPTMNTFIGMWGSIAMCILCGLALIIRSLAPQF